MIDSPVSCRFPAHCPRILLCMFTCRPCENEPSSSAQMSTVPHSALALDFFGFLPTSHQSFHRSSTRQPSAMCLPTPIPRIIRIKLYSIVSIGNPSNVVCKNSHRGSGRRLQSLPAAHLQAAIIAEQVQREGPGPRRLRRDQRLPRRWWVQPASPAEEEEDSPARPTPPAAGDCLPGAVGAVPALGGSCGGRRPPASSSRLRADVEVLGEDPASLRPGSNSAWPA